MPFIDIIYQHLSGLFDIWSPSINEDHQGKDNLNFEKLKLDKSTAQFFTSCLKDNVPIIELKKIQKSSSSSYTIDIITDRLNSAHDKQFHYFTNTLIDQISFVPTVDNVEFCYDNKESLKVDSITKQFLKSIAVTTNYSIELSEQSKAKDYRVNDLIDPLWGLSTLNLINLDVIDIKDELGIVKYFDEAIDSDEVTFSDPLIIRNEQILNSKSSGINDNFMETDKRIKLSTLNNSKLMDNLDKSSSDALKFEIKLPSVPINKNPLDDERKLTWLLSGWELNQCKLSFLNSAPYKQSHNNFKIIESIDLEELNIRNATNSDIKLINLLKIKRDERLICLISNKLVVDDRGNGINESKDKIKWQNQTGTVRNSKDIPFKRNKNQPKISNTIQLDSSGVPIEQGLAIISGSSMNPSGLSSNNGKSDLISITKKRKLNNLNFDFNTNVGLRQHDTNLNNKTSLMTSPTESLNILSDLNANFSQQNFKQVKELKSKQILINSALIQKNETILNKITDTIKVTPTMVFYDEDDIDFLFNESTGLVLIDVELLFSNNRNTTIPFLIKMRKLKLSYKKIYCLINISKKSFSKFNAELFNLQLVQLECLHLGIYLILSDTESTINWIIKILIKEFNQLVNCNNWLESNNKSDEEIFLNECGLNYFQYSEILSKLSLKQFILLPINEKLRLFSDKFTSETLVSSFLILVNYFLVAINNTNFP